MTTRLLSGTEMATRGPGIRGRRRELQSPLRPGGSSGAQRPGPRGVGGPSAPVQCAGPSSPRCPCRQPPLAARDRGLGANPGSAAVREPVAGCGVGLTQTASHLCHRPLACRGFCAQAGLRHSRPAAIRPAGRWSLVPTAPGFCLKQRPTTPSHTCGPSQTSSAFCTFSLQQRVCLSRSVRGWAASRWPAWPARPSPPGTLAPYLFSGSGAPTCKAAAGRGDNAP